MTATDRASLPLLMSVHAPIHNEIKLVLLRFKFYMIETIPQILIADKAYDSDHLD